MSCNYCDKKTPKGTRVCLECKSKVRADRASVRIHKCWREEGSREALALCEKFLSGLRRSKSQIDRETRRRAIEWKGKIYHEIGEYGEAIRMYRMRLKLKKKAPFGDATLRFSLAIALKETGATAEAIRLFDELLDAPEFDSYAIDVVQHLLEARKHSASPDTATRARYYAERLRQPAQILGIEGEISPDPDELLRFTQSLILRRSQPQ